MAQTPSRRSVRLSGTSGMMDPEIARQRQTKRDESIRRKLEQDLKKRGPTTRIKQTKKVPGTVSALRPAQALTVKENLSVLEAAQLMAAKRSDCVLVMNEDDHLCGILTAKDMAYRVVAENLNARLGIQVSEVMTPNPVCVTFESNAQDALNLMVSRGFRHVPVCSEDGDIYGLLDITKCLYQALDKMERAFGSSQKLLDALENMEKEWASNTSTLGSYMDSLRTKMTCPSITTVMTQRQPIQVSVKAHVDEVAKRMRQHRTTAVLVMDHGSLAGIFTTKDIVLRVIAVGLNPETCSVVRVMTPEPDTASPHLSVLDALKKMHGKWQNETSTEPMEPVFFSGGWEPGLDGHFMNLPVMDEDKTVHGLIDVLTLTYATLELIDDVNGASQDGSHPFWSNFTGQQEDNASAEIESVVSSTKSEAQGQQGSVLSQSLRSMADAHSLEKGMDFKFQQGSRTYRFHCPQPSLANVVGAIEARLENGQSHGCVQDLFYLDDDQDKVVMQTDADVVDAMKMAYRCGHDRIRLFVVFNQDKNACPHHGRFSARDHGSLAQQGNQRFLSRLPISQGVWFPTALTILGAVLIACSVNKLPRRLA
ncbi:CBS-domain-containing protein [Hesseltinella vesiculosa]|uniref:CBS-domain-containing protein n=1 Tax=Hesseltinella vesiculosa TaxID=101127 RepID=A0A1X2GKA4_9FUNG|nr:CBS-domain-containing protein [Hesseltinella vesiculosa]